MGMGERGVTVCVGDIHGYADKLLRLWRNLELYLGSPVFLASTFIFLGDYCDRGPHTSRVLDFLCSLPSSFPSQRHVFLCGNHDLAFSAFLHLLPPPLHPNFSFSSAWNEFSHAQIHEGWWSGPGHEHMHLQGRRWAGAMQQSFNAKKGMDYQGSTYDAASTFSSYGLPHGDPALKDVVPPAHKKFLQELVWVYEQDAIDTEVSGYSKLIAVHAGLEKSKPVQNQLKLLHERDVTLPRVEPLSGRMNVWDTPPELAEQGILVVSGHHGSVHLDKLRIIIDEGGGFPNLPIAAIILPSRIIVRDTDDPQSYTNVAVDASHC